MTKINIRLNSFICDFFFSSSLQLSEAPLKRPNGPRGGHGPHFEKHCLGLRSHSSQMRPKFVYSSAVFDPCLTLSLYCFSFPKSFFQHSHKNICRFACLGCSNAEVFGVQHFLKGGIFDCHEEFIYVLIILFI